MSKSECCEDWKKRVELLEMKVAGLRATIDAIHDSNKTTAEEMQRTVKAAVEFRDRVTAALEMAIQQRLQ